VFTYDLIILVVFMQITLVRRQNAAGNLEFALQFQQGTSQPKSFYWDLREGRNLHEFSQQ